jgi:alkanesulfonate monooxygenase SsuD/methylene tetrahydromethanopterin reductase-like flavin-dependent oxidoreductase (luciferase family)
MTRPSLGIVLWSQGAVWSDMLSTGRFVDSLGYDHLWTWDHLLPVFGGRDGPIFEGTTTLAALAMATEHVRLGLFVAGNTLRNPGLLAKSMVTLDHISSGRALCGIGAAWHGQEHQAYGIGFGAGFGDRLDWLEESASALRDWFDGEAVTSRDGHYRFSDASQRPKPVQEHLPILIGGLGERRTLRIVARYADCWNAMAKVQLEDFVRKMGVLDEHCAATGRDPSTIERSLGFMLVIRESETEARRVWAEKLAFHGAPYEEGPEVWLGNAEQIADRLRTFRAIGFDTFMAEIPSPYDRETIERLMVDVAPIL